MAHASGLIRLSPAMNAINELFGREAPQAVSYSRHFNQNEDFFLRLGREFVVPSFPIHHEITQLTPAKSYVETLHSLIDTLQQLIPSVFEGLTCFFNPAEVLRPSFFQVFRVDGVHYLYLLRLDLVFRPQTHTVVEAGSNDTTPVYRTSDLVVEVDVLPLTELTADDAGHRVAVVDQMISDTWIGETGRGYFVQGIWLDTDLSKFFTKLTVAPGKRMYPYYPFSSKYRTICHHPIALSHAGRRTAVPRLHRLREFLKPHLETIEQSLREAEFSEAMPEFTTLRDAAPESWREWWNELTMNVYLNEQDMKEFEIVEPSAE